MNYKLSVANPSSHYIQIEAAAENPEKKEILIQLPSWRPGRYELGNFAKNVRNFRAYEENGREIKSEKITKDRWIISCSGISKFFIRYEYYANELNAGSTFADENQLYVN